MNRPFLARLVAASLLACAFARGAAALEARLILPDGQPAAGMQVSVVGRTGSVLTDRDGRFILNPDPALPFLLVVTGPGDQVFSAIEVNELPAGALLEIELVEAYRDSMTVVSGVAPSVETLPAAAATLVTEEEIEQRRPQRIVDALYGLPGLSQTGKSADSVPVIRGLGGGRTLILLDGARVTTERRAGASATFVDAAALASVEVTRGPGAVTYGSDAFGGVIDARSRDPEAGPWKVRFDLSGTVGGIEDRGGLIEATGDIGGGALLVLGRAREADDGEAGGGDPIRNSAFEDRGAAVRYLHVLPVGVLRLGLTVDEAEDLGKPAADSAAIRAYYPEETSRRLTASWRSGPLAGWEGFDVSTFYGTYRLITERDRTPTATSNRRIDRSDIDSEDASLRASASRALGGGRVKLGLDVVGRFGLAAEVVRVSFDAAGAESGRTSSLAIEEANRLDTGVFALWDRTLGSRTSLSVGLRGDVVESENKGGFFGDRSQSESAASGHLALTTELGPGLSGTLQAARGFRSPLLSDRYFRGPSGRGFVIGNPELGAETSDQLDLALRWVKGRSSLAVYGYLYRVDDLIERFQSGDDFGFRNRGEAEVKGIEVEAQVVLPASFQLQLGATVARGEDTETGDPIAEIPSTSVNAALRWSADRFFALGRLGWVADDDRAGATEVERNSYTTLDLGGGYQILPGLELRAMVENVTDERYFESADNNAPLAPGRSFRLAVAGKF